MPGKYKLTRPDLKRFRDALNRFEHYLPMLKLKQQQLQMRQRQIARECRSMAEEVRAAETRLRSYQPILAERAGVPLRKWAAPEDVRTKQTNIAGVEVPVFEGATFGEPRYSLFATAPWTDQALSDMKELNIRKAKLDVLRVQDHRLRRALSRVTQRVNLFEKIKIPEAREAIRRIQIKLGDEMAAAVGRAKIAKAKIEDATESQTGVENIKDRSEGSAP